MKPRLTANDARHQGAATKKIAARSRRRGNERHDAHIGVVGDYRPVIAELIASLRSERRV